MRNGLPRPCGPSNSGIEVVVLRRDESPFTNVAFAAKQSAFRHAAAPQSRNATFEKRHQAPWTVGHQASANTTANRSHTTGMSGTNPRPWRGAFAAEAIGTGAVPEGRQTVALTLSSGEFFAHLIEGHDVGTRGFAHADQRAVVRLEYRPVARLGRTSPTA
ncbi:MAG: hypothetical protein N2483_05910 [Burkholderiaceae bacterium]|nr:hypothetical protein [Burkholderiaceae bacterium]